MHAEKAWLDPSLTARLLSSRNAPQKVRDSEANKIAALICEGLQNNDISARMGISSITVRNHLSTIFGKLGVTSRLELAIYAFRHGLAKTPR